MSYLVLQQTFLLCFLFFQSFLYLRPEKNCVYLKQVFEFLINISITGSPVLGTDVHLTALEIRIIYASMGRTKQQQVSYTPLNLAVK